MTPDSRPVEAQVRAALGTHPATRFLAALPLEPVRGGLSNHAWFACAGGRGFFVRLGGAGAASLGVDRFAERRLLETVSAAGLAPAVVACDPSLDLLVTERVAGSTWRREDTRDPRNIRRLAEVLRRLHDLEPPADLKRVSFAFQARQLEAQLRSLGVEDGVLRSLADDALAMLASDRGRLTVCHNDLHHLNVVDDGQRAWLVDWEYGGQGDPLFDLASFVCQNESCSDARTALLRSYGVDAGDFPDRLAAACTAFDYVQWLWYRLCIARGRDSGGEYSARAAAVHSQLVAVR